MRAYLRQQGPYKTEQRTENMTERTNKTLKQYSIWVKFYLL